MEVGKLTVQVRQGTGKGIARKLRAAGLVPGICYGANLEAPLPIQLSPSALKRALDPVKRQNTVIELEVEKDEQTTHKITAMLKEYQVHPIRRDILHVDLISIEADKPVEAEIPIKLVGKAAGLVEGGQLNIVRHKVLVRCKPADIPARLELDVTNLNIGGVLHVANLVFPEGVMSLDAERFAIVTCVAPAAEEEKPVVEAVEAGAVVEGAEKAEGDEKKPEGDEKKEKKDKK